MINTIKNNLEARRHDGELDRADAVQTVLIIAGFAIVVILIVAWIGKAIKDKGKQAAQCIDEANSGTSAGVSSSVTACTTDLGQVESAAGFSENA
jgi:hypothetical protein